MSSLSGTGIADQPVYFLPSSYDAILPSSCTAMEPPERSTAHQGLACLERILSEAAERDVHSDATLLITRREREPTWRCNFGSRYAETHYLVEHHRLLAEYEAQAGHPFSAKPAADNERLV